MPSERTCSTAPAAPVVILSTTDRLRAVNRALMCAPLVGDDVVCVPTEDPESVVRLVRGTIRRSREAHRGLPDEKTLSDGAMLERLLDDAPIGVVAVDPHHRVTTWNARAARLFDAPEAEVVGHPIESVLGEQVWAEILESNGPATFTISDRHLEIASTRWDGSSTGILLLIQDVTERVRLTDGLRVARQELERALEDARLANRRKDEFLAMLGHELRNPLAPIVTGLHLMRLREPTSPSDRERRIVERQVAHLVGLVDDLLDLSRVTRGKVQLRPERVELSTVVARALEMAGPLLEERGHALHVGVERVGLEVHGDPMRLAQVFANLLTNAAKYTEPNGHLSVVAETDPDEIRVRVRDDGVGIAPSVLPNVFDPFVQQPQSMDRNRGGLGIGLAIVRGLVELHGGRVGVTSELGQGSEFTVALPRTGQVRDASPGVRTARAARPLPEWRVLVVDDNRDAAELVAQALEIAGCRVDVAFDGPGALSLARHTAYQAALLDIGLPVMDGYELARHLREIPALAEIRLVAITGYGQEDDKRMAMEAGFDRHLVKPVALDELGAVLVELSSDGARGVRPSRV